MFLGFGFAGGDPFGLAVVELLDFGAELLEAAELVEVLAALFLAGDGERGWEEDEADRTVCGVDVLAPFS